jgi:hypothetical protein
VVAAHGDVLACRLGEHRAERLLRRARRVAVLVEAADPVDLPVQFGGGGERLDDVAPQPRHGTLADQPRLRRQWTLS